MVPPGLVGRREELAWLEFCAEEARGGRPRLAVVSGEAGIGKSRLLQALLGLGADLGACAGLGRGYEDSGVPYLPLLELLTSLETEFSRAELELHPDHSPASLLRSPGVAPAGGMSKAAPLLVGVSTRLIEMARQRPLLLAIDDLHWLDAASLGLLSHIAFAISDRALREPVRILMIVTTRPFEGDGTADRTLSRLRREAFSEFLELEGLDAIGTRTLMADGGVPHASSQLVRSVLDVTRGNPLFIETIVSELMRADAIELVEGDAVARIALEELPGAADVGIAVANRLASLGADDRRLLEYAALLGTRFEPGLLAKVVERPEEEVRARLAACRGMVRPLADGLEFHHPLLRHELGRRRSREVRQRRQKRIAEVLEREHVGAAWEVLRHWMASGPLVERDALYRAARRAGDEAFRLCAWREGGEAYAAAASVAPSQRERAALHFDAARCFMKNYDHGLCGHHFRCAQGDYEEVGDAVGAARVIAESARSDLYQVPLGQLRDMAPFERALEQLGQEPPDLVGALYARMADCYFYASRPGRGREYAQRALASGERAGDHDLCADAGISLALAEQQALHYRGAEDCYRVALAHVGKGEGWFEPGLRVRLGSVCFLAGRIGEARDEWTRATEVAQRLNDNAEEALAHAYLAGAAAAVGSFPETEEQVERALRLASRLERRPWVPMVSVPTLAYVRFLRGSFQGAADALEALNEPGRLMEEVGRALQRVANVYRALVDVASGAAMEHELQSSREMLARHAARTTPERADGMGLGVVCALVELAELLGMPQALAGPTRVLELAYKEGALLAPNWPCLVPRLLGLSAFARGEDRKAEALFEEALEHAARIGALPELARTQLEAARSLVVRGGREREQRARDLIEHACRLSSRLGMTPTWQRCVALARDLGVHVPERREAEALGERDLVLLKRLSRGHSDGRMASDLLLRPETLRRELTELFGRLGVEDRKEVAAVAASRGLLPQPEHGIPVTLMVTDLESFTSLVERIGDAEAQELIHAHNRTLRGTLRNHSGVEVTHTGDGVIASFRSSAEAVACAIEIQRYFESRATGGARDLRLRVGLHAGEPLPEENRLFGLSVNTAVRICGRCPPGGILASESVLAGVRALATRFAFEGRHALKGLTGETPLYRVDWRA